MSDSPVVIDYETEAIEDGTGKAPKPVGVAIWVPGEYPQYFAWGHPEGNNCDESQARSQVAELWDKGVLFHHGKFDIAVAQQHWGFEVPRAWHDTMYQIYLHDPLAKSVSLKPSAESLLGMPPEEQDAIADYVMAKGWTKSRSKAGAFISKCPASLVSPYAIGDVVRTGKLHEKLYPIVQERNWETAYQREIALAPILIDAERVGVRIDRGRLARDVEVYSNAFMAVSAYILTRIGQSINLDSGAQLAKALIEAGLADPNRLGRTPTGKLSTAQDSLRAAVADDRLLSALSYRGALKTLLNTFMIPWLEMSAFDGHLHPSWNQVKGEEYGTRTGRLSCSHPNLQNVPTEFEFSGTGWEWLNSWLPPLPFMRQYILPDEGEVIVAADYNGQEMRLLAHFAEGRAAEIYRNDPRADFHQIARDILHDEAHLDLPRKPVKIVGFSLIYGAGVANLAGQLRMENDLSHVKHIRNTYLRSIPGLEEFIEDVTSRPGVRTWGGRWIPAESYKYQYKLANHLIQGTAADQTKQSIIEYHRQNPAGRFLMTVHDENVISSSIDDLKENVEKLKSAMENLPGFDVPFIAEVEYGHNWHDLEPYNG